MRGLFVSVAQADALRSAEAGIDVLMGSSVAGIRDRSVLMLGKALGAGVRRLGRGGGTALPGVVVSRLVPSTLERGFARLGHGVIVVTGTNGKTTTAHLVSEIAEAAGLDPLTNRAGSNMERGLLSALAAESGLTGAVGRAAHRIGVLEIDEAELPALLPRLRPRAIVFLNLFRDQLDRYGEVASVAAGWEAILTRERERSVAAGEPGPTVVLNVDDPSIAALAESAPGDVVTFGLGDRAVALDGAEHASDARLCRCGERFAYDAVYMGHVGLWRCPGCGRRRTVPDVSAQEVRLQRDGTTFDLVDGEDRVTLSIPLVGLYSVYNALAAAAAARALGLPGDVAAAALSAAGPAFGRQECLRVDGHEVRVLLAKNPTGLNEVVRALTAPEHGGVHLLMALNDGIQDGEDVSWIYDADLELLAGRTATVVAAGDRAEDLALRLGLAGVPPQVVERDIELALREALRRVPEGRQLEVVPTYTAMLQVREILARMAGVAPYWQDDRVAAS